MPTSVPDLAVAEWLSAFRLRASSAETCDSGSARFRRAASEWHLGGGSRHESRQGPASSRPSLKGHAGPLVSSSAVSHRQRIFWCLGLDLGLGKRALVPSAALVDRASPKWEIQMLRILVLTARRRPVVPASPAREFPGDVADSALTQDDQAWRRLSSARSDGFPKPALIPFTSTSKEPEA